MGGLSRTVSRRVRPEPQQDWSSKAKNKLVHSILLWGALDDQSC